MKNNSQFSKLAHNRVGAARIESGSSESKQDLIASFITRDLDSPATTAITQYIVHEETEVRHVLYEREYMLFRELSVKYVKQYC